MSLTTRRGSSSPVLLLLPPLPPELRSKKLPIRSIRKENPFSLSLSLSLSLVFPKRAPLRSSSLSSFSSSSVFVFLLTWKSRTFPEISKMIQKHCTTEPTFGFVRKICSRTVEVTRPHLRFRACLLNFGFAFSLGLALRFAFISSFFLTFSYSALEPLRFQTTR